MRKIIQIAAISAGINGYSSNSGQLFALCDDGKLFALMLNNTTDSSGWFEVMPVPQDMQQKAPLNHHDMFRTPTQCNHCGWINGQHQPDCPGYYHKS